MDILVSAKINHLISLREKMRITAIYSFIHLGKLKYST